MIKLGWIRLPKCNIRISTTSETPAMKIIISLPTLIALLLCNNFGNGAEVDFKRDIAPLLKAKCIECHGLEKQKAGLRFDRKDLAFQGGDSGEKTINPGKPEDSLLIKMITVGREG
ncbi:MAG: hypothetical protein EBT02_16955, partial [Planctomycetia bacterium]|nr:hypothetical protein [Planctomycetia bacterium]